MSGAAALQQSDDELSFGERLRAARHAQLKVISDMISGLSDEEKKYLNIPVAEKPVVVFKKETIAQKKAQRKAKRIADKEAWEKRRQEEKEQKNAENMQRKLDRDELNRQVRQQRIIEREARKNKPKAKRKVDKKPSMMDGLGPMAVAKMKPLPKKHFEPIIGKVNGKGETPVTLDAKGTIIYVGPGKDVDKAIKKWSDYLKN